MGGNFLFYVHSEVFNPDNFKDENFNTFSKSINAVFEVARQLKAKVFYKLDEVQELKPFFEDIDYKFTQSQGNRLDILLDDFIPFKDKYHFFKVHFAEEHTSLEPVNYGFLNAMDDHQAIKIVFTQNASNKENLLLVQASHDFYFCEIYHFNQAKDIWTFINKHLPIRTYSFSSKHGNATTKAIAPKPTEKVSQLLCSDLEAQTLLNSAIFDLREKKFYYNFDEINDTYILFPYEGETPQNQFHAFHITHEEWHKEIPASIKKYFKRS
jgi:hypothetical protein